MVKFSVIVPVYNTGKYIEECLDSIVNQTFRDFEVIVVDDGTTDDAGAIADSYAQKYDFIRVIHKENGGLVSARKAGAKLSDGEYILNVDSDDYIEKDLLNKLNAIITNNAVDFVCFALKEFGEGNSRDINYFSEGYYCGNDFEVVRNNAIYNSEKGGLSFGGVIYGVCLKAVKRALYIKVQNFIDDSISIGEDTLFTAKLFQLAENMYILNQCEYNYRITYQSMLQRKDDEALFKILQVVLCLKDSSFKGIYDDQANCYAVKRIWNKVVESAIQADSYKSFINFIQNNLNDALKNIIKQAKLSNKKLKDKVIYSLLSKYCWRTIYFIKTRKLR